MGLELMIEKFRREVMFTYIASIKASTPPWLSEGFCLWWVNEDQTGQNGERKSFTCYLDVTSTDTLESLYMGNGEETHGLPSTRKPPEWS